MTTIAAITDSNRVFMGADSGLTDGEFVGRSVQPKVFKVSDMLIGFYGTVRAGNVVRYIKFPKRPKDIDEFEWVSVFFVEAVRKALASVGYPEDELDEDKHSFGLLVGLNGRIFEVEYNFATVEWDAPFMALGTGGKYAIGALDALSLYAEPMEDLEKLELAIGVAICNDPMSHGPVVVISE